MTNHNKGWLFV